MGWGGAGEARQVVSQQMRQQLLAVSAAPAVPPAKLRVTLAPSCGRAGAGAAARGWHMRLEARSWEAGTGLSIHSISWLTVTQKTSFLVAV